MSKFQLHEQIIHWFNELAGHTSTDVAVFVFAIASGHFAMETGRLGWILRPYLWPRMRKAVLEFMKWQVKRIFVWIRWATHTEASTWWIVFGGMTITVCIWLFSRIPIYEFRVLVITIGVVSLLTSFILSWREHGDRTTKSIRNVLRFAWAFWVAIFGYCAFALVSATAIVLLDYL
jgi:hypothetical protein